jgi:hypothetical protein
MARPVVRLILPATLLRLEHLRAAEKDADFLRSCSLSSGRQMSKISTTLSRSLSFHASCSIESSKMSSLPSSHSRVSLPTPETAARRHDQGQVAGEPGIVRARVRHDPGAGRSSENITVGELAIRGRGAACAACQVAGRRRWSSSNSRPSPTGSGRSSPRCREGVVVEARLVLVGPDIGDEAFQAAAQQGSSSLRIALVAASMAGTQSNASRS